MSLSNAIRDKIPKTLSGRDTLEYWAKMAYAMEKQITTQEKIIKTQNRRIKSQNKLLTKNAERKRNAKN